MRTGRSTHTCTVRACNQAPGPLAESIEGAVSALQMVNNWVLQSNVLFCRSVAAAHALRKPRNQRVVDGRATGSHSIVSR